MNWPSQRDSLGLALALGSGLILVMVTLGTAVPASDMPGYLGLARDGVFSVETGTWAAGREHVNGSWLFQRLAWWGYGLGGWPLLVAANGLFVALALALVGRLGWLRGAGLGAGVAVFVASTLMLQNTAMRPQTLAFLLAAAVLVAPRTWQVGALTVLWANLHGSFVLAPALALVRDPSPRRAAVAASAWLLNPFTFRLLGYVFQNSSQPAARGLDEWSSPELLTPIGVRLFFGLVVTLGVGLRRRPAPLELALAGVLGLLALGSVRHVAWFGLVAGPLLAGWIPAWKGSALGEEPRFGRHALVLMGAVCALGLVRFAPWVAGPPTDRLSDAWLEPQAPIEVLEALDRLPPGELNATYRVAGLVRWRHPAWTVRVDHRVWLYTDDEWARYEHGRLQPEGLVLIDRRREPWLETRTSDWLVLAEDADWSLRQRE